MTEVILGIDLGTTNSAVGVVDSGFPILLADADGERLTPSAVFYPEGKEEPLVGASALRARSAFPERCVTSVKRLIGRRPGEVEWKPSYQVARGADGSVEVLIEDRRLTPAEVSAEVLKRLKSVAEKAMGHACEKAVITVPAYFNDAQRSLTKEAGRLAGLEVVRILNEPTAAALAYGMDRGKERTHVAVYDLGGGTFDLSILRLEDGVFEVLSTCGDTALGGDDIDRVVAGFLAGKSEVTGRHLEAAEKAKCQLSMEDQVQVELPFVDGVESVSVELTREKFEELAQPLIEKTRSYCLRAVADSGLKMEELDAVVLVGGSTRIPAVRAMVSEVFDQEPDVSQNPDEAVALGAVAHAGSLSGALQNIVLLDVTPLSLGIETFGGLMNVIIPRNTTIPAKAGEMFTNPAANQASMDIRILQGEREMARDNWELGRVEVPFSPGAKGSARMGVQFAIDEDGILEVLCRDTATSTDTVLEIDSAAVDVDDEKVEKMVSESVEFAFEDMGERVWTEARLKSDELLPAVDEALEQAGSLVSEDGLKAIQAAAEQVRAIVKSADAGGAKDVAALKSANESLDAATQELAVMLVERAMEKAMEARGI